MQFDRPFTKLLIPFWQSYNVLPPEFLEKAIPYINYRGSFILRKINRFQGFSQLDLLDIQTQHARLHSIGEIQVEFQLNSKITDFDSMNYGNCIDIVYSIRAYKKLFYLKFDASKKLTTAEDEIEYEEIMQKLKG